MPRTNHTEWMRAAMREAHKGMAKNHGGPFGAVVVLNGKIIGRGHNLVTSTNDPTAHAEVVAIRDACRRTKSFHLPNAVIYASCEPCPMCLAAIYWANIRAVYFSLTKRDAKAIGFDDSFIYQEFRKPMKGRSIPCKQIHDPADKKLFARWLEKLDKIQY
ncbi:MAG TPA: nucleoside deaminase [Bacteroidota bacterium]|nr:nucleoside deaminase [Bacteroidota bacterium]